MAILVFSPFFKVLLDSTNPHQKADSVHTKIWTASTQKKHAQGDNTQTDKQTSWLIDRIGPVGRFGEGKKMEICYSQLSYCIWYNNIALFIIYIDCCTLINIVNHECKQLFFGVTTYSTNFDYCWIMFWCKFWLWYFNSASLSLLTTATIQIELL